MFRGDRDVPAGSCSSPQTIRPDKDPLRHSAPRSHECGRPKAVPTRCSLGDDPRKRHLAGRVATNCTGRLLVLEMPCKWPTLNPKVGGSIPPRPTPEARRSRVLVCAERAQLGRPDASPRPRGSDGATPQAGAPRSLCKASGGQRTRPSRKRPTGRQSRTATDRSPISTTVAASCVRYRGRTLWLNLT